MRHVYYLEIAKEADLGVTETGEPSEAYLEASFNSDETYYTEPQILKYIAKISDIPQEHIRLITEEEYRLQTEGESA